MRWVRGASGGHLAVNSNKNLSTVWLGEAMRWPCRASPLQMAAALLRTIRAWTRPVTGGSMAGIFHHLIRNWPVGWRRSGNHPEWRRCVHETETSSGRWLIVKRPRRIWRRIWLPSCKMMAIGKECRLLKNGKSNLKKGKRIPKESWPGGGGGGGGGETSIYENSKTNRSFNRQNRNFPHQTSKRESYEIIPRTGFSRTVAHEKDCGNEEGVAPRALWCQRDSSHGPDRVTCNRTPPEGILGAMGASDGPPWRRGPRRGFQKWAATARDGADVPPPSRSLPPPQ